MFGIEDASIEILQEVEIFIESLSIVLLEVGIEDKSSLLHKKSSFFTIDKLSYMLSGFLGFYEGNPCRIWSAMLICDHLDTLAISQDIVEWHDLAIDLGDRELISESRVYRIGKIYWRRSLRECDNVSLRCEDEYLIREDIHTHLTHELFSLEGIFDDSLDRLHPVAILRSCRLPILGIFEMCCHSDLCLSMHARSTHLYLSRLGPHFRKESDNCGME